jgi:hypothetical protein
METRFKKEMPSDAYRIKEIGNWVFYFSKSTGSLYVSTSEYHSGPLKLTREIVTELGDIIDKHRDEMEKEIVSELEIHLASITEKKEYKEVFKGSKIKLIMPGQ